LPLMISFRMVDVNIDKNTGFDMNLYVARADLPGDDIVPIADTLIVRPDP